jgi:hypothetical protein
MQHWFKTNYRQDIDTVQAARLVEARSRGSLLTEVDRVKLELR